MRHRHKAKLKHLVFYCTTVFLVPNRNSFFTGNSRRFPRGKPAALEPHHLAQSIPDVSRTAPEPHQPTASFRKRSTRVAMDQRYGTQIDYGLSRSPLSPMTPLCEGHAPVLTSCSKNQQAPQGQRLAVSTETTRKINKKKTGQVLLFLQVKIQELVQQQQKME